MKEKRDTKKYFYKPSRTKQAFKNECDLNIIIKRFSKRFGIDYLERFQDVAGGEFGDFSNVMDYQSALNQIIKSEDAFMSLPAMVRKQFDNSAAKFLDFYDDPANEAQLVLWGLKKKAEPVSPGSDAKNPEGS